MTGTVRATLAAATAALTGGDAARDAERLLQHALGQPRAWLYAHADDAVDASAQRRVSELVARRNAGEPLAYITGRREFWTLELDVSPAVLIPRPETELLVELAIQRIAGERPAAVADLGTGSGAVALAIARERPLAQVLATDTSAAALDVARGNVARLGVGNVGFALGDWCQALGDARFDLVVSNPPYVAAADPHLRCGDLRFEPEPALTSGSDGLDAIRAIVEAVPAHLHHGAWLLLEHGFEQGRRVRELLETSGFVEVFTSLDLEHRERVSGGRWPG